MPRNGSGAYTLPSNSWNPAVTGATINSSDWNSSAADLVAAMSASLAKDGQTRLTAGLPWPVTPVPSADPNTLDDYTETTFTPVLNFGGATTGITYTFQTGNSTKIGNRFFYTIAVALTSKGSATGAATISGFPISPNDSSIPMFRWVLIALNTGAGETAVTGTFSGGVLQLKTQGNNIALGTLTDAAFSNTSSLVITGNFQA